MQITRESIQEKTPFKILADICPDCGTPHSRGYDIFSIKLPWRTETIVPKKYKWRTEEYEKLTEPLLSEFKYIAGEDFSKMEQEEKETNHKRLFELLNKLDTFGVFLTKCEYQLKATYDVGANNLTHCIITYVEYNGDITEYGDLFQANLGTVEELASIYETVSNGFDVESTSLNIFEDEMDVNVDLQ